MRQLTFGRMNGGNGISHSLTMLYRCVAVMLMVVAGGAFWSNDALAQGAPTITSYFFSTLPQGNPNLTTQPPTMLNIFGTNFTPNMTVTYFGAATGSSPATYISATSLLAPLPAIGQGSLQLQVSVCSSALGAQTCSNVSPISTFAPALATGTLTANPNPGLAPFPSLLMASFGLGNTSTNPSANPAPGAPSGLVSFTAGGNPAGSAKLMLDPATGSFVAPAAQSTVTLQNLYGAIAVAGDINGDGLPDVLLGAASNYNSTTGGSTNFLALKIATTPYGQYTEVDSPFPDPLCNSGYISQVGLGDFNGDGRADLIYTCFLYSNTGTYSNEVGVALGNGDGTFQSPIFQATITANNFIVGDFNHDGKLDFITSGQTSTGNGFVFYAGDGKGGFATGVTSLVTSTAFFSEVPPRPLVADMNGDGYPDLVLYNFNTRVVEIYQFNASTGNFGLASSTSPGKYGPTTTSAQVGTSSSFMVLGDFNGDGLPDVAVAESHYSVSGGAINTLLNTSSGGVVSLGTATTTAAPGLVSVEAGDFNGDGLADLVIANGTSLYVLNGNPDGSLSPNFAQMTVPFSATSYTGGGVTLLPLDVNGDGYSDLFFVTSGSSSGTLVTGSYITSGGANAAVPVTLPTGSYPLTAAWLGNANYGAATAASTVPLVINGLTTTTNVSATPAAAVFGQPVTFAIVISGPTGGFGSVPRVHAPGGIHPDVPGPPLFPAIGGSVLLQDRGVTIATLPVVAGLASGSVTTLTAGSHSIAAVYLGDATYAPSQSLAPIVVAVAQAQPVLTWAPTVATLPYGTGLSAAQLNATAATTYTATVPGAFAYTPAIGTVLQAGVQTLTVHFTPSDTVNFSAATKSITFNVTQGVPTIVWATPAAVTAGTVLSATQLDARATGLNGVALPGTFTYTPVAGTALNTVGPTPLSVVFAPTDEIDYTAATAGTTVQVTQVTPTIVWPVPAAVTAGSSLTATQLNATATGLNGVALPGTFTYTPPVGTQLTAAGVKALSVQFAPTNATTYTTTTATNSIVVNKATPVLVWPVPTSVAAGSSLTATQLNATATGIGGVALTGTFTYTPPVGTQLTTAGSKALAVQFVPTDAADYNAASATNTIVVGKATPTIVWATPAAVSAGTVLSATQLDATATGINGVALTGTFTYTPAAGTVLTSGTKALSVLFTAADATDYVSATGGQSLQVIGGNLSALTPQTANLGDAAKVVTVTGVGFGQFSSVLLNGSPLVTTFISSTTLTAQLPASAFAAVTTLNLSVADQALGTISNSLPFTVVAPTVTATLNGPPTSQPGQQPSLSFNLPTPYPVPLTGTLTLTFTPSNGNADDPAVQFASGGRTLTFTLPANATATTAFQLQAGTVTGTLTVTLTLTGGGANVTPPTIQPLAIQVQPSQPLITSTSLTRSQRTLTVVVHGFSNTRQLTEANFHFTAAPGASVSTTDIQVPVGTIFAGWFGNPASEQYGSIFTYTQSFTLDQDASTIGSITVTLVNSVGQSTPGSAQ